MEKIQELVRKPLVTLGIGFLIGLIIGLPVLGWGLFPVQWEDAAPYHLRADLQDDYFCMTVQSYLKTGDAVKAQARLEELGPLSEEKMASLAPGDCGLELAEIEQFKAGLGASEVPLPGMGEEATQEAEEATSTSPVLIVAILCLVTLVIGGALAYIFFIRNRGKSAPSESVAPTFHTQEHGLEAVPTDFSDVGQEPPIAQFMTTYVAGDDLYDDSFSIDSPSGEFLGECGVGISETIGVGEPKKVTAFEVWLFDKNDIQTVTKVLMSTHAYDDPDIAQRLASKGEPVLLEPGSKVILDTATLQLEARVVDMNYGQGALPEGSFFDRMTLELAVWPKNAE